MAAEQGGALSWRQALDAGLTPSAVAHRCSSGRWQHLHPGVYVTFTGEVNASARAWAALLHAGPDAVLSHRSAAAAQGLLDHAPDVVDVTTSAAHRVTPRPGIRLHRTRHLAARRHPVRRPPQTRIEDTVLDLVELSVSTDDVVGWLTRGVQRRLTTVQRLRDAADLRGRLRHRRLVASMLAEIVDGIASPLELRYARNVERAHGLPGGVRGQRDRQRGRRVYRDVAYEEFRTYVELDGVAYHEGEQLELDAARDNLLVVRGDASLRYGWSRVNGAPCQVAGEVAAVLRARGWLGLPTPCGPGCTVRLVA
jgi:very-short-patch-repair endonuclease